MRLYNEIVELMLAARYRNRSISPFNSVPIMHISKCDFATFWHIHSDNLLVQSAVSRFWGIPPCELRKNLREAPRRSLYKLSVGILTPPWGHRITAIILYLFLPFPGSNTPLIWVYSSHSGIPAFRSISAGFPVLWTPYRKPGRTQYWFYRRSHPGRWHSPP